MSRLGAPATRVNTFAILSLIVAATLAPAGIPLAVIALRQIKRTGERGREVALVGLWIGFVLTAIYLLVLAFVAVVVGWSLWFIGEIPEEAWR
jgi:peptidyl-prolyl cis-trans isomerase B (cyclophilin B)